MSESKNLCTRIMYAKIFTLTHPSFIHRQFGDDQNKVDTLKAQASNDQWEVISELTFNDLRYDFAQRARKAGWGVEEVADYLGQATEIGAQTLRGIVPSTQVSREQLKLKLNNIKG